MMCQEALDAKHMKGQVDAELLKLIDKGAKKNMVGCWREIAFLMSQYKVLAKVLGRWIKTLLQELFHMRQ